MNEEIIHQLEEIGLSNKEARVYLANLMLGAAGVQQIADISGIKRVTTYVILEALVNLGLVSQTNKGKKTLFNAEAPQNLRRLLDKKEQSVKDQKQQLESLLPDLKSLKVLPKNSPSVKFYDSVEGITTIVKTFMSEGKKAGVKKVYGMSNLDQLHVFFPEIAAAQSNPERINAGITSQYVYTSKKGPVYSATDKIHNRESRFIPYGKYPINGDISIVGDKVALLALSGARPIGVVIESAELAKTFLSLFQIAWDSAQPQPKSSFK